MTNEEACIMDDAKLTGGSEADRKEILRLHEKYIDVNTRFDWEGLTPLYSPSPEATYFNLNGHTYNGRDHWIRLWKFYGQNVASTYWTPFDIGGVVTGDLAVVWCHRKTRRQWTGKEPPPRNINYDNTEFISRSTMVFRREDGQWRVVHAHFSPADSGPRPGGV
jgi:ketosteroid isomerase-like protein